MDDDTKAPRRVKILSNIAMASMKHGSKEKSDH